jgi:hypothetical protein
MAFADYKLPSSYAEAGIDVAANDYTVLVHFRGTW